MSQHTHLVNGNFDHIISPSDRGFNYGDGVFRTLVMRDGLPEYWPQHYQKLVADCSAIGIVCPSAELLMADLQQLFTPDEIAVAKIIVTRGEGSRGYSAPAITAPTRVVSKSAMPEYPEERFLHGVNLLICETRLAKQPKLAGVKHLNRLENVLARMEWQNPRIVDGIMLDGENHVIECTSANIFARFDDVLITPSLHQCGVAGVMRQMIMQIAHTLSLKVRVETFDLAKLFLAEELIICNSLYGAWQVSRIQDKASTQQKAFNKNALAGNVRKALREFATL